MSRGYSTGAAAIASGCCCSSSGRVADIHGKKLGTSDKNGWEWKNASTRCLPNGVKCFPGEFSRNGRLTSTLRTGRFLRISPANGLGTVKALTASSPAGAVSDTSLEKSKYELLRLANETGRGLFVSADQRAEVEEAMIQVEKFNAGKPLELDELDGTWLLQYTSAPDVVGILQAARTPFIKVGQIFQKFECRGRVDGGSVKNVVRWSIPGALQDDDGATLVVDASFSVVSPRSIALSFQEAKLGEVQISEELQGLIAPAIFPRSFFTLQILQFLRSFNIRVPLIRPPLPGAQRSSRVPIGLRYYLTYLDRDMLVGRALGNGGVFIFSRTQRLELF
ncbi:hypothetical protein R1sor_010176 [Riccia sorocarpa]|uniref:Plastid lipid-associated protein/fibrillin conserved domain-containing protein n=1 Tax=Riccia sorocarpa TaxID=122646 RepID=A0ABD3I0T9_9MARC